MADLSLVMIVKDGEDRLEEALRSALPYVADAYVLDTGSTDSTPDILARLQREYVHLRYDVEPWEGTWHFSNARNKAAERALHPWVLVLDADEELREGERLVDIPLDGSWSVGLMDVECVGDGPHINHLRAPRIYDRRRSCWKGRVHNQLVGERTLAYWPGPCVVSYYTGKVAEKAARSLPLLHQQEEDGDPWERDVARFFLAKTYWAVQDWPACLRYCALVTEGLTSEAVAMSEAVVWQAYSALFVNGLSAMRDVLATGSAIFPDSPHLAQAWVAYWLARWKVLCGSPGVQARYSLAGLTPLQFESRLGDAGRALGLPINIDSIRGRYE